MADFDGIISTSPEWVDIPSLSTSAIALGGTAGSGAMNAQAVALAKRTNYLINYSVQISPTTGNAGIGTSSAIGRFQIGDASVNIANKLVFGKAQASTEANLPAIGQKSAGVGNDLAFASTSASGSVKVFTGASTNSGEIGTGSNTEKFRVDGIGYVYALGNTARMVISPGVGTNNALLQFQNTGGNAYVGIDSATPAISSQYALNLWHNNAYPIVFGNNNTIRMTIDSSGILNKYVSSSSGAETVAVRFTNGVNTLGSIRSYNSGGANQHVRLYSSNAGTEILGITVDHNTNVGLGGITPKTWSGGKAVEIGASGNGIWSYAGEMRVVQNMYYNSGWTYASSAPATHYEQNSAGSHVWWNAPSGTIDTPITFKQAMTLDVNGNLGVGAVPSPWQTGHKFVETGGWSAFGTNGGNNSLVAAQNVYIDAGGNWILKNAAAASIYTQLSGGHAWYSVASGAAGTAGAVTNTMTLTSSGNLSINDGHWYGWGNNNEMIRSDGSGNIIIRTNTNDRLFVGNNGNIGFKTNTPSVSLDINATDGIKIPSGTTAQRVASEGVIRKNTTTNIIEGYTNGVWQSLQGGLLNVQVLTRTGSTQTYTKTPGTRFVIVELIGAGGGGGGCPLTSASQRALSQPGGPGDRIVASIDATIFPSTVTVVIGAGGSAGAGLGGNGGYTMFGVGGSVYPYTIAANGGNGGNGGTATSTFPTSVPGVVSNGSVFSTGGSAQILHITKNGYIPGSYGIMLSLTSSVPGQTTNYCTSYGYGGIAIDSGPSSAASNGFPGGNGAIIVYEYA